MNEIQYAKNLSLKGIALGSFEELYDLGLGIGWARGDNYEKFYSLWKSLCEKHGVDYVFEQLDNLVYNGYIFHDEEHRRLLKTICGNTQMSIDEFLNNSHDYFIQNFSDLPILPGDLKQALSNYNQKGSGDGYHPDYNKERFKHLSRYPNIFLITTEILTEVWSSFVYELLIYLIHNGYDDNFNRLSNNTAKMICGKFALSNTCNFKHKDLIICIGEYFGYIFNFVNQNVKYIKYDKYDKYVNIFINTTEKIKTIIINKYMTINILISNTTYGIIDGLHNWRLYQAWQTVEFAILVKKQIMSALNDSKIIISVKYIIGVYL